MLDEKVCVQFIYEILCAVSASRLAFLVLFNWRRPVWQFGDFPDAPSTKEVMANFSKNLRR